MVRGPGSVARQWWHRWVVPRVWIPISIIAVLSMVWMLSIRTVGMDTQQFTYPGPKLGIMTGSRAELDAWHAAINQLDPKTEERHITPADRAALENPTTLAAHLWKHYKVRAHLTVVGEEIRRVYDGDGDRLVISLPPQIGKPVYAGTMILMGDGSRKRIDEVQVGDRVITHTGQPRLVSAVHQQGQHSSA